MDLRFTFLEGALDKSTLHILEEGSLSGRISLEAGVIGASHFVSYLIDGKGVLNEVFACMELNPSAKAHCGPLGEISGSVDLSFPSFGVKYRFVPLVKGWEKAQVYLQKIEHKIAKINETKLENSLGLRFDFPANKEGRVPKTLVWVNQSSESEVTVETVHSYPHEGLVVFTRSNMQLQ